MGLSRASPGNAISGNRFSPSSVSLPVKPLLLLVPLLLLPASSRAEEAADKATWLKEAELPAGFPAPGPYGAVVEKSYPTYRAASTNTKGPNIGFWTLFSHIERNEIAMTAPVEMTMSESGDGDLAMEKMAFLYQDPALGEAGPDGTLVEVVDVPAMKVLSLAWRGPRSEERIAESRKRLLAEAQERGLKGSTFRLLGYNSPSVPRKDRTHELQLILE